MSRARTLLFLLAAIIFAATDDVRAQVFPPSLPGVYNGQYDVTQGRRGRRDAPLPAAQIDFTQGVYNEGAAVYGSFLAMPGASFARNSPETCSWSNGTLTYVSAGSPCITDLGLGDWQASANLALQSQNFSATPWTQDNTTASTSGTAPDGTSTAQVLNEGTATGAHFAYQTITVTSGQQASVSEYVNTCTTTRRYVQVGMSSSTPAGGVWATFDTQGLTFTEATASGAGVYATSNKTQLDSCWWRISVTGSITGATTYYVAPELASTATPGGFGFTGQSYAGASLLGVFWGFQVETIAPTPYMPTTTASASRAADVASISGLVLTPRGTIIESYTAPGYSPSAAASRQYALFFADTGQSRLAVRSADVTNPQPSAAVGDGTSVFNFSAPSATTAGQSVRFALAYDSTRPYGDFWVNGQEAPGGVQAVKAVPTTLALPLYIGSSGGTSGQLNGYVKGLTIYQQIKSQLQNLTH